MLEKIIKEGRLSIIFLIVAALFISSAAATTVSIGSNSSSPGGTAIVPLMITGVTGVAGAEINITFDPSVVDIVNTTGGDFDFTPADPPSNRGNNFVIIQVGQISNGLSDTVKVADITLKAIGASGQSALTVQSAVLSDINQNSITVDNMIDGTFTIQPDSGATVSIGSNSASPGGITIVPLMITGVSGVGGAEINITFDPAVVDIVNTTGGDFDLPPEDPPSNRGNNFVVIQVGQISTGLNAPIKVADITLKATGTSGQSDLIIQSAILTDINQNNIPVSALVNGIFTISGPGALSISANPTTVVVGVPTSVTFNVTINGAAVSNATVTLSGNAAGTGTTDAAGIAIISVNAIALGTITATADLAEYTSGTTTLNAIPPSSPANGAIIGTITSVTMTPITGATVDLKNGSGVIASTITDASGNYNFTDVIPGSCTVKASITGYHTNSTDVTLNAGQTIQVDMILSRKGDLNDDGQSATADDVNMMIQASVGDIIGDARYDLDGDGIPGTAVDVNMMIQASVGDIDL